jgi:hypothetical protein
VRQPWPPTTTPYRFAVHVSTVPGHSAGVTVSPSAFTRSAASPAARPPSPWPRSYPCQPGRSDE